MSVQETAESMKSAGEEGGSGFGEAMEGMGEAMEGFKERADGMLENLTALTGGWTGLLSVIGAGAVGELLEHIAETTLELGDSMRQTGAALNVGADEARGFNEAMSSLGVSPTAAAQAIRRLEMDASNGGKQLERLGVSATEASGEMKSGEEIFLEVIEKLNNLSDANQRAEAGFTLLGRGASQLLGVLPQIPSAIEEATAKQQENSAANQLAEKQSLALHQALTELKAAFEDGIIKMSPLVVGALQVIATEVDLLTKDLEKLADEAKSVFDWLGKVADQQSKVRLTGDIGGRGSGISGEGAGAGDTSYLSSMGARAASAVPDAYSPDAAALHQEGGVWAPKGGGGRGGGKGGGADPMAGMDNALDKANDQIAKLNSEFAKMGDEATMAAKEGGQSYDQLRDKATQDYQVMQAKYKEFQDAVASGSKQAAQQADQAWHTAARTSRKIGNKPSRKPPRTCSRSKAMLTRWRARFPAS